MSDLGSLKTRLASFCAVVLIGFIVGVPLWIGTTSVERLSLPDLTFESINNINYSIPVYLIDIPEPLMGLVNDAQLEINNMIPKIVDKNININVNINLHLDSKTTDLDINDQDQRYKIQLVMTDRDLESYAVSTGPDRLIKLFITENLIINDKVANFIARTLVENIFGDELNQLQNNNDNDNFMKINYHPNIIISLNLLRAGSKGLNWDLKSPILNKFINFVKLIELNGFANFQIETQEDWYEKRIITPHEFIKDGKTIIKDTSTFIDYSGWGLDQNVGLNPVINFVIYVPDDEIIEIENSHFNSFIVPQWGGLVIQNCYNDDNVDDNNTDIISEDQMNLIFDIFASQLIQLIGGSVENSNINSIFYRIDQLTRLQTINNIINSIDNIQSLKKLTMQLQTIPIPLETVNEIKQSIDYLTNALQMNGDRWWIQSNYWASSALKLSDRAFFQKDMLQQVYFPEEHKTAVYSPLLGPVCTILILGFVRLTKEYKKGGKVKGEGKTQDTYKSKTQ